MDTKANNNQRQTQEDIEYTKRLTEYFQGLFKKTHNNVNADLLVFDKSLQSKIQAQSMIICRSNKSWG